MALACGAGDGGACGHWEPSDKGGQCGGLFWRHARYTFLQNSWWGSPEERKEAVAEYERPWCEANGGDEALEWSLNVAEEAFLESLERGDTLASLCEAASDEKAEAEAAKAAPKVKF